MSLCPDTETQLKKKKTAPNWEHVHLLQGGDEKFVQTIIHLLLGSICIPDFMLSLQASTGNTKLGEKFDHRIISLCFRDF